MIDYPRWMFHREHEMRLVQNEEEEVALGPEWSRKIQDRAPSTEKEARRVPEQHEPGPPFDPDDPEDAPEKPDEQPQERARPTTAAPSARKKRKA